MYLRLGRYYRVKGEFLDGAGRHDEASSFYHKSLESLEKAQMLDRLNDENWRKFRLSRGVAPEDIPDMGNFAVYQQLGLTYTRLGDLEKCETAGQFLQHHARSGDRLPTRRERLFQVHRYAEAAVQLVAALLVEPDNTDSWANADTRV